MRRSVPPLQGIEAFIAATKAGSFRAAADLLALSPSAFSRRIQTLENFVGVALFDRSAGRPQLTEAGEQYFQQLQPAVHSIREATLELKALRSTPNVRIMCSQSFAITWLMPRLQSLAESTDQTPFEIVIGRDLEQLRIGRAEIAISSEPSEFGSLPSEPLICLDGVAVTAPAMVGGKEPPKCLGDLADCQLLAVETPHDLWGRWLNRAGGSAISVQSPTYYQTLTLMYEAAANGFGVAIAVSAIADRYLQDGRLQPCFELCAPLDAGYHVVFASDAVKRRPHVQTLVQMLKAEMNASQTSFREKFPYPPLVCAKPLALEPLCAEVLI